MVGVDRLESVHTPAAEHVGSMQQQKDDIVCMYHDKVLCASSPEERLERKCEVSRKIKIILQHAEPKQRLPASVVEALEMCFQPEEQCAEWRPSKAVEGLRAIEAFTLNLWDFPWKKEFHSISTFSGYYKTRIEFNFGLAADRFFALIGYQRIGPYLCLDVMPGREQLCRAAAELVQAAVECEIQETILEVVEPYGVSALQVYMYRRSKPGSIADSIERLKRTAIDNHNLITEGDVRTKGEGHETQREKETRNISQGVAHADKEGECITGGRSAHIGEGEGVYIQGGDRAFIGRKEGAHIGGGDCLSLQEDDIDHEHRCENEEKRFGSFVESTTTLTTIRASRPAPPPPPPFQLLSGTQHETESSARGGNIPIVRRVMLDEPEFIEGGVQYGFPSIERYNMKKKPTVSPSKLPPPSVWGVEMQDAELSTSAGSFDRSASVDRSQYLSTFKREIDDRPGRWVTGIHSEEFADVAVDGASGERYDASRSHGLDARRTGVPCDGLVGRGVADYMTTSRDEEMNNMAAVFMNLTPEHLADSSIRERFLTKRTGQGSVISADRFSRKPSQYDPSYDPSYVQIEPLVSHPMQSQFSTARLPENSKATLINPKQMTSQQSVTDSSLVTGRTQLRQEVMAQPVSVSPRVANVLHEDIRSSTSDSAGKYPHSELVGRSVVPSKYLPPTQAGPIYAEVRGGSRPRGSARGAYTGHQGGAHWTCQRCTLVNDHPATACVACNSSRITKL